MSNLTARQVYDYASRFEARSIKAGKGTQWPTMRKVAQRFRTTLGAVEEAVEGYSGPGYLGIAVGVGIPGAGSAEHSCRGECQVEAYGEPPEKILGKFSLHETLSPADVGETYEVLDQLRLDGWLDWVHGGFRLSDDGFDFLWAVHDERNS